MSENPLVHFATDLKETDRLGTVLAGILPQGSVVALIGALGAGKTRLVQAVAATLGVDVRDVVSPTFVFLHEYQGHCPIYHFDAYRIKDDDEFMELGPDEYFESSGITFVEWADRVQECLPADHLVVEILVRGESEREFRINSRGSRSREVVARLSKDLVDS